MTRPHLAPAQLLVASLLLAVAVAVAMTLLASRQPWMGLRLGYDQARGGAVVLSAQGPAAGVPRGAVLTQISGGGDSLAFEADDFVYEPDGSLGTYANYETFLARQGRLAAIQASPAVTLQGPAGRWTIAPQPARPLNSLPPDYWVQIFVGVVAWLIAAGIWAFRQGETSVRYLLLSGLATLVFSPFAAVYSTREMALDPTLFRFINDMNFLGGSLFAAALASLFLYYPKKLAPPWAGWAIVALFVVWFAAQELGAFESMTMARRLLVLLAVLATFLLAGVHWRLTRNDPVARAALQWFLLSWLVGITVFCMMIFIPQMFGIDTSALQGYGFLLFLLIYVGLAFGVLRFRLFDLGEWWLRVMVWAVCVVLLVLLDMGFLLGLHLSGGLSLSLALLICGLVWLPLRGWLWGRFMPRSTMSDRSKFETVLGVALTPGPEAQTAAWEKMLQGLFDPLHIRLAEGVGRPQVERDGLALALPGAGAIPPLRLEYAQGGRRLFSRRDAALGDDLAGMLAHALESRRAYEDGVTGERKRISRDMHDNIGAQLLRALHSPGEERKDRLIRETLFDLGSIISDSLASTTSLDEALADLRAEAGDRLGAAGVALEWPLATEEPLSASPRLVHGLRSIIREALSNVIKHAGASTVRVDIRRVDGEILALVEDDGVGLTPGPAKPGSGHGLANIEARAALAGGEASWSAGEGGRGVRLSVRLPLAEA